MLTITHQYHKQWKMLLGYI